MKRIYFISQITIMGWIGLCCSLSCNNNRPEEIPQNVLGLPSHKTPIYSSATLRGTEWVADYSNKDQEYRIRFTDSLYMCTEILLGKAWVYAYPYYISETPDRVFDKAKVGKETAGDYFVFYYKDSRYTEVMATEIFYASPTKLVLIDQPNDTVYFTRRN